jgi:hypothetical protein
MKKRLILIILFPTFYVVLTSSGGSVTPPWEKENVSFPMMNQEIRHTMQENERQKTMKNWQNTNVATETVNKKQWEQFKEAKVKIQDRLRIIDFAMQAIPTGYAIFLESQKIKDTQMQIISEIQTAPYSLVVALPAEIKFVDDMQMIVRLLTGIVLSYGAINQMEKAERKILLQYALGEVTNLYRDSYFMLRKIIDIKQKVQMTKFVVFNYINKDKQIVKNIMSTVRF